jgi:protocatechuate 3,4-dioxygenase beta subunit
MWKISVSIWYLFLTAVTLGQQAKTVICTGRIVDFKAQPVDGAEIAAYEKFYDYSTGKEYTKPLDRVRTTDANGYFTFDANISTQYNAYVIARKNGLAMGWDIVSAGSSLKTRSNLLIILEKPCLLAGTVVDDTGKPFAGAKVQAVPKTSYLSRLHQRPILAPEEWFATKTDENGKFSFDDFAADVSADFRIEAPGRDSVYKCTTYYLSSCGFEVGRTDVHIILPPEGMVQGKVVDAETGEAVADIELLIKPNSIREILNPYVPRRAASGWDGSFRFDGIPVGKHILEVIAPEKEIAEWVSRRLKIEVQKDKVTDDVVVEVEKGGIFEATVLEGTTKNPVQNVQVSAYSESSSGRAWTDANGMARFRVPSDEFKIYVSAQNYSYYRSDSLVTVAKSQTTQLEILLDRKIDISGIVLDESGRPLTGALVDAYPTGDTAISDADGRFEVGFDQRRPSEKLIARHMEQNLAAIVDITDSSKPMEITLKPALEIAGHVTDANNVGIPAARLSLSLFESEVLTDTQGRYKIKAVPPEQAGFEYRVSVNTSGYGPIRYQRISITGEPGAKVEMKTHMLEPANESITGVVVDANGLPAARVPIFLHSADGSSQPEKTTATNEQGRFVITRICKGPLRLQANFGSSPGEAGFLYAKGGDRDVKIILGKEGAHRPQVSLVGKPLPELKDYGIDLSPAETNGKIILVCILDLEQRPSRHYVTQLTKQAEQLKNKGVIVIAVQASKMEQEALDQWVKKYNIPFPVGMVKDDMEKTRFTWGVKSLPWLILTDGKHLIRMEGFALNELEAKLQQIGGD